MPRKAASPTIHCASNRLVRCLWCRGAVPLSIAAKHQGVCPLCLAEIAELNWRVVYDRERRVGAIPQNLREAYRL
jgi:hypothetical protein